MAKISIPSSFKFKSKIWIQATEKKRAHASEEVDGPRDWSREGTPTALVSPSPLVTPPPGEGERSDSDCKILKAVPGTS
ncbi:unnamed protein product [Calypogeia fissa]